MCQKKLNGTWTLTQSELNLWELFQDLGYLKECVAFYAHGVDDAGKFARGTLERIKPQFSGYDWNTLKDDHGLREEPRGS